MNQIQQNLSQIASLCNQLSQNEQTNATRLSQVQQAEHAAAQQLQHCAQLCNQVTQQMQQIVSGASFSSAGQYGANIGGIGSQYGNWSHIPVNTSFIAPSGQYTSDQYGNSTYGIGRSGGLQSGVGQASTWANVPVNTTNFSPSGQYGFSGQMGSSANFQSDATGRQVYNTNNDLYQ